MKNEFNKSDVLRGQMSRRRFIGLLSASVCGFYLTANQKAEAAELGIPDEWVRRGGNDVIKYARYLKSLRLKHVTPNMVLKPHFNSRSRVKNSIPPKELWANLKPTLIVIDKLSSRLGCKPKEILSVYRSPRYNRAVRGRKASQHLRNTAIDIKYPVSPWRVAKEVRKMRRNGAFKGGVGDYSSFVHIDTRGVNRDW